MRRREAKHRMTEDGLLRDAREWSEEDWRDLHEAIDRAKRRIAARHRLRAESGEREGEGDE